MPVRSLSSRIFKWPDRATVEAALREWVAREQPRHPEARRIGLFGSYARGDWGVGSDVDLIAIVDDSLASAPFTQRALDWDLSGLPVPAELLVYTQSEWAAQENERTRFAQTVAREAVWLFDGSHR